MTKKNNTQRNADEPNWGLFYKEHSRDLHERKSIKVKLPIRQHIKLHALKLFTENNISETVEIALDEYFDHLKDDEGGEAADMAVNGAVDGPAAAGGDIDAADA